MARTPIPPGTVQLPKFCSTYDTRPVQAGTLRGSCPSSTAGSVATWRSRSSLSSLPVIFASVSRLPSRSRDRLLACSADHGRSSQSLRSASQASGNSAVYAAHARPRPSPRAASMASICTDRLPLGRSSRVPSSNRCCRIGSTGTRSSSFSSGRPDLRKRSRTTAGSSMCVGPESQRNPSRSTKPERATEPGRRLEQGDLVAQLGQPRGGRHAAEAAPDHHHPRHVRNLSGGTVHGPAAADRLHGGRRRASGTALPVSAAITRDTASSSRPTTVVPSSAVMIGRWSTRGCAASAASHASR